jgi:threonine aldolase
LAGPVDGNEIFAVIRQQAAEELKAAGAKFYAWDAAAMPRDEQPQSDEVLVRLVTSWATSDEEVALFVSLS